MFRPALAIIIASVPAVAHADGDKLELGSSVVASSESSDVRSSDHAGVVLTGASWLGHVGLVAEAGHQPGNSTASWIALGARVSPASSPRRICDRSCISLRPWFELGAAREMWTFDEQDGSHWRTSARTGFGVDVLGGSSVGGTLWFRVQHANERPSVMSAYGEFHQPYETSLVVGAGLFFTAL